MGLKMQIGGNNASKVMAVRDWLLEHGVEVAHPITDEFMFELGESAWQRYNAELDFYETIADVTAYVIVNGSGEINQELGNQIAFAMGKHKPLVFTQTPHFSHDVDTFTRRLIESHIEQFHVVDLLELENGELAGFIQQLTSPVNYHLSTSEQIRIRRQGKSHFRELLESAKRIQQPA